jgi:hypothetical protein
MVISPLDMFRKVRKVSYNRLANPEYQFISHPKTGRTWLRVMIGKVLCEQYGMQTEQIMDYYQWQFYGGLHLAIHHDDVRQPWQNKPLNELNANKARYANNRVLFLVRDPRDTVVSWYFELSRRRKFYQPHPPYQGGAISDFIRDPRYGIDRIIRYYAIWQDQQHQPNDFLLVRYEDMHGNPHQELERVLAFLRIKSSEDVVNTAVAYAGFDNMRKLEQEDAFKTENLRPTNAIDNESYKVRKGKIGGYTEYLSDEDIHYINERLQTLGCAFYPEVESEVARKSIDY